MANIQLSGLPAKVGTILDAGYLHLSESGIDYKMTVLQLLSKISSQYSADIQTFLGSGNNQSARINLAIDRRVAVDDADYTILNSDKEVAQIGTMSAVRTFSLPAASTVKDGAEFIIVDESGSLTSTNYINVQRDGTDLIDGQTQIRITEPYGILRILCNGVDGWKISNETGYKLKSLQVFTSSGTWTKPNSVKAVGAIVIGAGGQGGSVGAANPSTGGGSGGLAFKFIKSGLNASETVTVGTGGTGGGVGANGNAGSLSSFGAHCSATGGTGGKSDVGNGVGIGGIGISGDLNFIGSSGGSGVNTGLNGYGGAALISGAISAGSIGTNSGDTGKLYGGGGGGSGSAAAGANGADGIVIILEYI